MLGAVLVIMQVALAGLANIELVSVLIIVYTCVFGWYAFIPTYVFVVIQLVLYGFNIWSYFYIYCWAVLIILALPLRHIKSPVLWAMVAGAFGLIFGALSAVTSLFIGGWSFAVAYWINGLLFDFVHCAANFVITLFLYKPLLLILEYGKEKLRI